MPRLAWLLMIAVAVVTAGITTFLVAGEGAAPLPAGASACLEEEVDRLVAENDGLRRRLEDALSEPAHLTGRPETERPPTASEDTPATGPVPPRLPVAEVNGIEFVVQVTPPARDQRELLKELVRRGRLHDLLRDIATDPVVGADVRVGAADALIASSEEEGLELLAWLMDGSAPSDRRVAFGVLTTTGNPAIAPLLRVALRDPDRPEDLPALRQAASRLKGRGWNPRQATGEPDTHVAGDLRTAWASKKGDMGEVWLELDYERAVVPESVRVHETYNPGAIARIEAKGEDGSGYDVLWEGTASAAPAPHWFEPILEGTAGRTRTVRLVLDTDRVPGWNEIDAVELVGEGHRQWAVAARASSSYGAP